MARCEPWRGSRAGDFNVWQRTVVAQLQDVLEWLALPEFKIPQSRDIVVNVVRAGIMVRPLALFEAAGIRDPVPLGDGVHGVLGTITIETESGSVLMRLPQVVGGWAAECFTAVQQGIKPFPARVRFRPLGPGVEVSFVDFEPKTIAPVRSLVVFVDESGNTGDAAIVSGDKLVGEQPSFALVGLGAEDGVEGLSQIMIDVRTRHGIQANEIKTRVMDRRPGLVIDLINAVRIAGLPVFVELMDKAYFVATNVVTYVLAGPWLSEASPSGWAVAKVLADVLTEHVDQTALVAYCDFGRSPTTETFELFAGTFRRELARARERALDDDLRQMLAHVSEIFEESVGMHRGGTLYTQLLPPADRSLRGKIIAMLPHVSAFTNLYARINRFSSDATSVRVIHDEQSHFGTLLRGYASTLESNEFAKELLDLMPPQQADWEFKPGKFVLDFGNSENSAGIQAADILARFCTRRMNAIIDGSAADDDPIVSHLLSMNAPTRGVGVNIVSTTERNKGFWGRAALEGPLGL